MPVTSVVKDADARTMTITARFDAPIERVWRLWSDPRQLERWWGPPDYPATVTEHDLVPGGTVAYAMTGPNGDQHTGWWRVRAVDAPHALEFEDGAAELPTGRSASPWPRWRVAAPRWSSPRRGTARKRCSGSSTRARTPA